MSTKRRKTSSRSSTAPLNTDFSLAIARLLEHTNTRDTLLVRLLVETGITPQELISLKKTDIEFPTQTLHLREETTKHHVSRRIQLTSSLTKNLLAYAHTTPRKTYLFSTRQSEQLSTRRIEQIFTDASKATFRQTGIDESIKPKDCRENYLTLAKKTARTKEELKTLTGLKSIQKRRTLNEKELSRLTHTLKKAPQRTQNIVKEFLNTGAKLSDYVQKISSDTHKVSQLSARRIEQIVSKIGTEAKIDRLTPEVLRATALERNGGGAQ